MTKTVIPRVWKLEGRYKRAGLAVLAYPGMAGSPLLYPEVLNADPRRLPRGWRCWATDRRHGLVFVERQTTPRRA